MTKSLTPNSIKAYGKFLTHITHIDKDSIKVSDYITDELWKHYAKWKKSDTKWHILYYYIYRKCPDIKTESRSVIA